MSILLKKYLAKKRPSALREQAQFRPGPAGGGKSNTPKCFRGPFPSGIDVRNCFPNNGTDPCDAIAETLEGGPCNFISGKTISGTEWTDEEWGGFYNESLSLLESLFCACMDGSAVGPFANVQSDFPSAPDPDNCLFWAQDESIRRLCK